MFEKGDCINYPDGHRELQCKVGITIRTPRSFAIPAVVEGLPCRACKNISPDLCSYYKAMAAEEAEARNAERRKRIERSLELIGKDISPCCEAPLDRERIDAIVKSGGCGWIYCPKCGKQVIHLNNSRTHRPAKRKKKGAA